MKKIFANEVLAWAGHYTTINITALNDLRTVYGWAEETEDGKSFWEVSDEEYDEWRMSIRAEAHERAVEEELQNG